EKDSVKETPKAIAENTISTKVDSANKTNEVVATQDTASKKDDSIVKANLWTLSPVLLFNGGYGIQTTGGVETTRALSKHWNIGAGLYYMYFITSLDHTTARTFTNTNYDFGSSYNTIKIAVDRLHYAMLNAFVEFKINKKNALVAGTNIFYLVTTSNTITKTNEGYSNGSYTSNGINYPISHVQEQKKYGYTTGLSPWVVSIMGGYRRKIIGGLDIGLYINYATTGMIKKNSIKDNSLGPYFPGQLYNSSIQLELKYNLFRKVKK